MVFNIKGFDTYSERLFLWQVEMSQAFRRFSLSAMATQQACAQSVYTISVFP